VGVELDVALEEVDHLLVVIGHHHSLAEDRGENAVQT
jgi:hypothetical protein